MKEHFADLAATIADLGREITIRRGGLSATVSAAVGRSVFEVENESGIFGEWQSRDYLIRAAEYAFGGEATEPAAGDRIEETEGDATLTYEVMAPAGRQAWHYSDPYRQLLRVHTVRVN